LKILVLSDLHLEFAPFYPAKDKVDVVVLAGDIWTGDQAIAWARNAWPDTRIIYVAGNHEFYKRDRLRVLDDLRASGEKYGVDFLENDEVVIDGVRFLGCTLWTDFQLFGNSKYLDSLQEANRGLNDFRLIMQNNSRFTAEDSETLHHESRGWLKEKLFDQPINGQTVVVTHHCPSWHSVAPRFQDIPLAPCFASRLEDLLGASTLWVHGHTHDSLDYVLNETRVVCNPRGYVLGRNENEDFNQNLIIKLDG
jgi:Icc-related predicted phosphoesterase